MSSFVQFLHAWRPRSQSREPTPEVERISISREVLSREESPASVTSIKTRAKSTRAKSQKFPTPLSSLCPFARDLLARTTLARNPFARSQRLVQSRDARCQRPYSLARDHPRELPEEITTPSSRSYVFLDEPRHQRRDSYQLDQSHTRSGHQCVPPGGCPTTSSTTTTMMI